MRRKRILKNLRLIILILLGAFLGTIVGGIYYINQSGINDRWRDKIALELENFGIIADFKSLKFEPSRGLVAKGVRIYSDKTRKETIATLEHLVIDVDKTKLIRGKLRMNNVSLSNAEISLPIDPNDPEGPRIIINEFKGNMFLPDKNTIQAQDVQGIIAGINLTLDAHIWSNNLKKIKQPSTTEQQSQITRIKIVAKIIQELTHWSWPTNNPPNLIVYAEGNMDDPDSAHIEFKLTAKELERDGVRIQDIHVSGDYNNKLVTLDQISLKDDAGLLSARADFQQNTRTGRFKVMESSLHLQILARKLLGINPLQDLTFSTPPRITCVGQIRFDKHLKPEVQLTGEAKASDFTYQGSRFKKLNTDISLQGTNVYFTDIHASHAEGSIKGRVMIKDGIIRYEEESTLPFSVIDQFAVNPKAQQELDHAQFGPESKVFLVSKGTIDQNNPQNWKLEGHGKIQNFSYKGVPMNEVKATYHLNADRADFSNIQLSFNYRDYVLRKKYGGPMSGQVDAARVTIDHKDRMVHIKNIRTTCWPAPVVRLFAPNAADHCEQYRFIRPPNLTANGSFDLNHSQARTDFKINIWAPGSTNYDFLGESLTLRKLRGKVRIRQDRVDAHSLSFSTFQGPCQGKITVNTKTQQYQGDLNWSRLHLKDLGQLYKFDNAERGLLTGRIEYSGQSSDISRFNGNGSLAMERGNLFSVPMMGPLSPVIEAVLGKKNSTTEQAENASFTYAIQKGVIYSDNFLANTRSLRFTGEGKIDLNKKHIDLLVRMNARGFFSLITLPFKPFMGLFQFNGTGSISDPQWKTMIFTAPKRGKKDPIFRRPPKARVINE